MTTVCWLLLVMLLMAEMVEARYEKDDYVTMTTTTKDATEEDRHTPVSPTEMSTQPTTEPPDSTTTLAEKTTVIKTTTETSLQSPKPKGDNLQPEQLEAGDNKTAEMTSEQTAPPRQSDVKRKLRDCYDILVHTGQKSDGVYTIYVGRVYGRRIPLTVYCDMTTSGGGWTVLMRRQDGSVGFYLPWKSYKEGFGNLTGEFWLGNENINMLTSNARQRLRIDMGDFEDNTVYAEYNNFLVGVEEEKYRLLTTGTYSGTADDSLAYHIGAPFSTVDQDTIDKCAHNWLGAWWYKGERCHRCQLTGVYLYGQNSMSGKTVIWFTWRKYNYSLKSAEMKIRPFYT